MGEAECPIARRGVLLEHLQNEDDYTHIEATLRVLWLHQHQHDGLNVFTRTTPRASSTGSADGFVVLPWNGCELVSIKRQQYNTHRMHSRTLWWGW